MKNYNKEENKLAVIVLEELNQYIKDSNDGIGSSIIPAFLKEKGFIKEELEVDQWYIEDGGWMFCYKKTSGGYLKGYGFNPLFFFCIKLSFKSSRYVWRKMSKKEVSEALFKEAKKKGFKEDVKYISAYSGEEFVISNKGFEWEERDSGNYTLTDVMTGCIFRDGKWATIIEEPAVRRVTMEELEKNYGCKVEIVNNK